MKKIFLMALAGFTFSCTVHAASFDCTKAQTKVETLICEDPELSKLDEEMAPAFKKALKAEGKTISVRQGQQKWLKERNACGDLRCVKKSYMERLTALTSKQMVYENSPTVPKINPASNHKICAVVSEMLLRISKLPPPQSYENPFYVESTDLGGRSYEYQNVDLDGDEKSDKVEQSCGSSSDGTCTLYVALSGGGGYRVDEDIFQVMRVQTKYYLLVGHSLSKTNNHRRLYALSEKGAELLCKSF